MTTLPDEQMIMKFDEYLKDSQPQSAKPEIKATHAHSEKDLVSKNLQSRPDLEQSNKGNNQTLNNNNSKLKEKLQKENPVENIKGQEADLKGNRVKIESNRSEGAQNHGDMQEQENIENGDEQDDQQEQDNQGGDDDDELNSDIEGVDDQGRNGQEGDEEDNSGEDDGNNNINEEQDGDEEIDDEEEDNQGQEEEDEEEQDEEDDEIGENMEQLKQKQNQIFIRNQNLKDARQFEQSYDKRKIEEEDGPEQIKKDRILGVNPGINNPNATYKSFNPGPSSGFNFTKNRRDSDQVMIPNQTLGITPNSPHNHFSAFSSAFINSAGKNNEYKNSIQQVHQVPPKGQFIPPQLQTPQSQYPNNNKGGFLNMRRMINQGGPNLINNSGNSNNNNHLDEREMNSPTNLTHHHPDLNFYNKQQISNQQQHPHLISGGGSIPSQKGLESNPFILPGVSLQSNQQNNHISSRSNFGMFAPSGQMANPPGFSNNQIPQDQFTGPFVGGVGGLNLGHNFSNNNNNNNNNNIINNSMNNMNMNNNSIHNINSPTHMHQQLPPPTSNSGGIQNPLYNFFNSYSLFINDASNINLNLDEIHQKLMDSILKMRPAQGAEENIMSLWTYLLEMDKQEIESTANQLGNLPEHQIYECVTIIEQLHIRLMLQYNIQVNRGQQLGIIKNQNSN